MKKQTFDSEIMPMGFHTMDFSTAWKTFFHTVEKGLKTPFLALFEGLRLENSGFPRYGKLFGEFSTVWKTFGDFFHAMENFLRIFPQYGNFFRDFSTVWKTFPKFFHSMENFFEVFPRGYGKLFPHR